MFNTYEVTYDQIAISFGDQATSLVKIKDFRNYNQSLAGVANKFSGDVIFLHQTHSTLGVYFNSQDQIKNFQNFASEGDYLISSIPNLTIGVLTADCLPVIFYDPIKKIVAVIHAGWRGSVAGILPRVLADFEKISSNSLSHLQVWFGPAAQSCCYEVQADFRQNLLINEQMLTNKIILQACFTERNQRIFFDLARYNYELLLLGGILKHNINRKFNLCTICNKQFCSYRRDGIEAGLQVTKVLLKP